MISTRAAGLLAIVTASLAFAGCGDDDPKPTKTASTGQDKQLTIYSGREEEYVAPLVERFEKATGVKTEVRYGDTAELAATLIEEGDRSPADLFFAQDAGALGAVQRKSLFATLPAKTLNLVPARYRSRDGAWVGTSGRARVLAYDKRELKTSELPSTVYDLVKPEWKGKVGWAPTNASFQSFVTAMRKVDGDEKAKAWLEGMKANDAQAYEKNSILRDAIKDGEVQIGLINHYYVLEAIAEEGGKVQDYPVAVNFPDGDIGSFVNAAGIGILAGADHAGAAQAFVDYVLSAAGQKYFADDVKEYALIDGVPADPSLPALSSIKQPDIDLSDLDDLQGTLDLMQDAGVL